MKVRELIAALEVWGLPDIDVEFSIGPAEVTPSVEMGAMYLDTLSPEARPATKLFIDLVEAKTG